MGRMKELMRFRPVHMVNICFQSITEGVRKLAHLQDEELHAAGGLVRVGWELVCSTSSNAVWYQLKSPSDNGPLFCNT